MKPALHLSLLVLFAACGSSSPPPPLFGGFAPAGGTAVIIGPTTCNISPLGPTSASAMALVLTDFADACGFVTDTSLCGSKQDATLLVALAVSGRFDGGTATPFGPGTYPFLADPPSGPFTTSIASAVRTEATSCGPLPNSSTSMTSGQVVVTAVTATRVTGTLDLRFRDGSAYQQPFDVARCDVPVNLCSFVGSTNRCFAGISPWTCQPP